MTQTIAPMTVDLSTPLKIGEKEIKQLTIRKPNAGELRGVKMIDVLQMDVESHAQLIPRICEQIPATHHVYDMDAADITYVMGRIVSFLKRTTANVS